MNSFNRNQVNEAGSVSNVLHRSLTHERRRGSGRQGGEPGAGPRGAPERLRGMDASAMNLIKERLRRIHGDWIMAFARPKGAPAALAMDVY